MDYKFSKGKDKRQVNQGKNQKEVVEIYYICIQIGCIPFQDIVKYRGVMSSSCV